MKHMQHHQPSVARATAGDIIIRDSLVEGRTPAFRRLRLAARVLWAFVAAAAYLALETGTLWAGTIPIPNGSFESPETDFADPRMDGWQKAPEPAWYQGGGGFPWDQLMGQFLNTTNGSPDHIDNMDGRQAAFLFALPEVAVFQDSIPGSATPPFNAQFEAGKSYALTVGLLGGGGGMSNGATFQISMYYRDAASNMVTVAATTITNTQELFPTNTHFTDFQARTPLVQAGDAWAGKGIGLRLASTVGFDLRGGYWNVDHVRLEVVRDPILIRPVQTNGQFQFILESDPGRFEILTSSSLALPMSTWTSLATLTNVSGSILFTDTNPSSSSRFYQARQSP
jgi:hypothetical protein